MAYIASSSVFLMLGLVASVSGVEVVTFQPDGKFTNMSYVKLPAPLHTSTLRDFSLCFRIKLYRLRGAVNFAVSYATSIADNTLTAGRSIVGRGLFCHRIISLAFLRSGDLLAILR